MCCACDGGDFCRDRSFAAVGTDSENCVPFVDAPENCGTTDDADFIAADMCCACDVNNRWTICEDIVTDAVDSGDNGCDYYTEEFYAGNDQCGSADTADFVSSELCCVCFSHDMGLPSLATDMADFNLPVCEDGTCTYYSASDPGANYFTTFSALPFSVDNPRGDGVEPAAGEAVYSYFELTEWWIEGEGPFNPLTITPYIVDDDGVPIDNQPDFSDWTIEHAVITTEWENLEDPETYDEHLYYKFLMKIPETWDKRDYDNGEDTVTMTWQFKAEISIGDLHTFSMDTSEYEDLGEWTMTMAEFSGDWLVDYEDLEASIDADVLAAAVTLDIASSTADELVTEMELGSYIYLILDDVDSSGVCTPGSTGLTRVPDQITAQWT